MSEKKFSVVIGLGGNSYSNLHVSGDSAEELRDNIKAARSGPQGESALELAVETVRGIQGLYAAAQKLTDPPKFLVTDAIKASGGKQTNEEPKVEPAPAKKAPAKKGVAAKKAAPKAAEAAEGLKVEEPRLAQLIQAAATEDDLNKVWKDNKAEFLANEDELKPLMVARRAELKEQQ